MIPARPGQRWAGRESDGHRRSGEGTAGTDAPAGPGQSLRGRVCQGGGRQAGYDRNPSADLEWSGAAQNLKDLGRRRVLARRRQGVPRAGAAQLDKAERFVSPRRSL